jgi:hypothetical protein
MSDFTFTTIQKKCIAIVCFGPHTDVSGMRPADYYQVTIDPEKISPSSEFIRFGTYMNDEINGWQRCSAMTVVVILAEWDGDTPPEFISFGTKGPTMMKAE